MAVIYFDGKFLSLADWSKLLGVSYEALRWRKRRGWSTEKMLLTPVIKRKPMGRIMKKESTVRRYTDLTAEERKQIKSDVLGHGNVNRAAKEHNCTKHAVTLLSGCNWI